MTVPGFTEVGEGEVVGASLSLRVRVDDPSKGPRGQRREPNDQYGNRSERLRDHGRRCPVTRTSYTQVHYNGDVST